MKKIQKEEVKSDNTTVVNDFVRQKPFGMYRPIDYKIPEDFLNKQEEIDKYLEALFAGDIDDANGNVLDNLIVDAMLKAVKNVNTQKIQHMDTIQNYDIQAQGAKESFVKHKEMVVDSLNDIKNQISDLKERYQADKFTRRTK